jgi:hypothetical protein
MTEFAPSGEYESEIVLVGDANGFLVVKRTTGFDNCDDPNFGG